MLLRIITCLLFLEFVYSPVDISLTFLPWLFLRHCCLFFNKRVSICKKSKGLLGWQDRQAGFSSWGGSEGETLPVTLGCLGNRRHWLKDRKSFRLQPPAALEQALPRWVSWCRLQLCPGISHCNHFKRIFNIFWTFKPVRNLLWEML